MIPSKTVQLPVKTISFATDAVSRGHDMALLQKLVRAPSVTCSPTELPVTLPKILVKNQVAYGRLDQALGGDLEIP